MSLSDNMETVLAVGNDIPLTKFFLSALIIIRMEI